ncbi:MAG: family 20 glycosylhydrolase, partial [Ruthenibacterium sp.]
MAEMHSNALILELEDKRPFPKQPFLQAKKALTQVQIQQLTEVATENFIELIPLQQSFSHLEYVLKYPCYSHLRELENTIGEICPQNPDSIALSTALLESAAEVFPKSIYLHLGSDEVWSIGSCERCKKTGRTNGELMIQYVNQLIDIACKLGKKPLIWCDMFLNCTKEELTKLDKRVIAVVWMYDGNDLCYQASKMIDMFIEAGLCVWGGCSVRCWDKSGEQNYPLLGNRKANILAWGKLIQKYALEGIVNTNWSAYSALASPYGVYETSFYPCFFAASCAWNRAESSQAFLGRYLRQFHGVEDISFLSEGWQFEDYYRLLPRLHAQLKRGQEMCTLMEAVAEYECVTKENFPASLQLFR